MAHWLRAFLILVLALLAPAAAQSQTASPPSRVALVIANGSYEAVPKLSNPARDGALIVAALRRAGFTVSDVKVDLTKPKMDAALRDFKRQADTADIALVYYAGHGIELEEENWLLPVDAKIADPADALTEGVSLSTVLRYVQGARRLRVVVLDACRNNPFAMRLQSSTRAVSRGLKPVEGLPAGTIVAYAASFGQEAAEGLGSNNSPFAAAVARRVVEPGLEVRFMFANVRDDVIAANASSPIAAVRNQRPWIGAELSAEQVFFVPPAPQSVAALTVLGTQVSVSELGAEVEAFDAASRTWTVDGWRTFLTRFPNGRLKAGAQQALASIERPATAPTPGVDPLDAARRALSSISLQDWHAAESAALVSRVVAASSRDSVERLAAQGDARAQFIAGWAYGFGHSGFPYNAIEAGRLVKLASDQGDPRGQSQYAQMLRVGCCGVQRNAVESLRLKRASAEQGDAGAQASLGVSYSYGIDGLAQNKAEALRLYRLAAAQGNALGQANLGNMYSKGEAGLTVDTVEAVRLFRLAAAQGNGSGQANLAFMYYAGLGGLAQDKAEAVRLFRLAAAQNDVTAQTNLGVMYSHGEGGLPVDLVEAARWYRLGVGQGDAAAQNNLAGMYERGDGGLTANRAEAVRLYQLAARQGYDTAQQNLRRLGETW